ncbi:hypothetical protein CWI39_0351p0010 [Hamiltosporidium magnivora]|uniref:Uncharacterized protein n=1 Tax=Hamiltosporidium magnivora TaxID=148818 RepID=A0A4Q9LI74_9MICR|nr:hypothetical protein CWI39_0351p0010 [Hamiltosporidium magnivora]
MNFFSTRYKKRLFEYTFLPNLIIFLYASCLLDSVSPYGYIYGFIKNEKLKIRFFIGNQQTETYTLQNDVDFKLTLLNDESTLFDEKTSAFTYGKNNFISFEVLDNILSLELSDNPNGKIECNFNLYYSLKLTRDIFEIPDEVNYIDIKNILFSLKYLKAVKNKNMTLFLQALIVKVFLNHKKPTLKEHFTCMEGLLDLGFWCKIDLQIKEIFLSSFLNIYMVKYIFQAGNLIISENIEEFYYISIFDEHIPYKNILINSGRLFLLLEKLLHDSFILKFFQILLEEINLKSLIVEGFIEYDIPDTKFSFLIFSLNTFKLIALYNFIRSSSSLFTEKVCVACRNDIEFLRLEFLNITMNVLQLFLEGKKLKGLVLKNVRMPENILPIDRYIKFPEILDYLVLENIEIDLILWKTLFLKLNVCTLILSFNSISTEKSFINEFYRFSKPKNVLCFEVSFCTSEISKEFCNSLFRFQFLRTLKLQNYETDEQTELYLVEAIKNMDELENLTIKQCYFSTENYSSLFMKRGMKTLHFENDFLGEKILKIDFAQNYRSLKSISFLNMTIEGTGLNEIFRLENLEYLSLSSCVLEQIIDWKPWNFKSFKLRFLYLNGLNLEIINNLNILSRLIYLEVLDISYCMVEPGYLTSLNLMCNIRLRILISKSNVLGFEDLNRIKKFEVLENLNLLGCKFQDCNFYELGIDCMFLNSLKILNLQYVKMGIEDFRYLKRFANLNKLSLSPFTPYIFAEKDCWICLLTLKKLSKCQIKFAINDEILYYFYINEI